MEYFELEPSFKPKEYIKVKTVEEAVSILRKYKEKARIISGGTIIYELAVKGLIPEVEILVDIEQAGLNYIKTDGEGIKIGATTTLDDLLVFAQFKENGAYSAMGEAVVNISPIQIRNVGTVGGEICASIAYCDLPIAALVFDAMVKAIGPSGERKLPLEGFFLDTFLNVLEADELMAELIIPKQPPHTGSAFTKLKFMAMDYPIVNATARITLSEDGKCRDVRIVIGSNVNLPSRARNAERILKGKEVTENIAREVAVAASDEFKPLSDVRASASYRKEVSKHILMKTILMAAVRAKK